MFKAAAGGKTVMKFPKKQKPIERELNPGEWAPCGFREIKLWVKKVFIQFERFLSSLCSATLYIRLIYNRSPNHDPRKYLSSPSAALVNLGIVSNAEVVSNIGPSVRVHMLILNVSHLSVTSSGSRASSASGMMDNESVWWVGRKGRCRSFEEKEK